MSQCERMKERLVLDEEDVEYLDMIEEFRHRLKITLRGSPTKIGTPAKEEVTETVSVPKQKEASSLRKKGKMFKRKKRKKRKD